VDSKQDYALHEVSNVCVERASLTGIVCPLVVMQTAGVMSCKIM